MNKLFLQTDKTLYLWFHKLAHRNKYVDRFSVMIARFGPLFMLAVLGLRLWMGSPLEKWLVLGSILAATTARTVNGVIRARFLRQRPYCTLGTAPLLWNGETSSFPSNHAAGAFALALPLWLNGGVAGQALLAFAFVLALSRVYVGVHYPSDVVAGAMIGSFMGGLMGTVILHLL